MKSRQVDTDNNINTNLCLIHKFPVRYFISQIVLVSFLFGVAELIVSARLALANPNSVVSFLSIGIGRAFDSIMPFMMVSSLGVPLLLVVMALSKALGLYNSDVFPVLVIGISMINLGAGGFAWSLFMAVQPDGGLSEFSFSLAFFVALFSAFLTTKIGSGWYLFSRSA